MDADISQAINSELNFLIRDGWEIIREPSRFRLRAKPGTLEPSKLHQLLSDETWRIARFVAYSHFASVAKNPDGSFTIQSSMASGDGFEIVVEAAG